MKVVTPAGREKGIGAMLYRNAGFWLLRVSRMINEDSGEASKEKSEISPEEIFGEHGRKSHVYLDEPIS